MNNLWPDSFLNVLFVVAQVYEPSPNHVVSWKKQLTPWKIFDFSNCSFARGTLARANSPPPTVTPPQQTSLWHLSQLLVLYLSLHYTPFFNSTHLILENTTKPLDTSFLTLDHRTRTATACHKTAQHSTPTSPYHRERNIKTENHTYQLSAWSHCTCHHHHRILITPDWDGLE